MEFARQNKNLIIKIMLLVLMFASAWIVTLDQASAYNLHTLPKDGTTIPKSSILLKSGVNYGTQIAIGKAINNSTYKGKIIAVNQGSEKRRWVVVKYDAVKNGKTIKAGSDGYIVRYTTPKAARYNGKDVKTVVDVTQVVFSPAKNRNSKKALSREGKVWAAFTFLKETCIEHGVPYSGYTKSENYSISSFVDVSTSYKIMYADGTPITNISPLIAAYDIDVYESEEGTKIYSKDFKNDIYWWGNRASGGFHGNYNLLKNHGNATTKGVKVDHTAGLDSWYKAGVLFLGQPLGKNSSYHFTSRVGGKRYQAGTVIKSFLPAVAFAPKKTVSQTKAYSGDTLEYRLTVKMPSINAEYMKLNRLEFTDTLDSGLQYQDGSVSVTYNNKEITGSKVTFNADENLLTVSLPAGFYTNLNNYTGQNLDVRFKCKIIAETGTISNSASVNEQTSNTVKTEVLKENRNVSYSVTHIKLKANPDTSGKGFETDQVLETTTKTVEKGTSVVESAFSQEELNAQYGQYVIYGTAQKEKQVSKVIEDSEQFVFYYYPLTYKVQHIELSNKNKDNVVDVLKEETLEADFEEEVTASALTASELSTLASGKDLTLLETDDELLSNNTKKDVIVDGDKVFKFYYYPKALPTSGEYTVKHVKIPEAYKDTPGSYAYSNSDIIKASTTKNITFGTTVTATALTEQQREDLGAKGLSLAGTDTQVALINENTTGKVFTFYYYSAPVPPPILSADVTITKESGTENITGADIKNIDYIEFAIVGITSLGADYDAHGYTDSDGVAKFKNVPVGTYNIYEVGYDPNRYISNVALYNGENTNYPNNNTYKNLPRRTLVIEEGGIVKISGAETDKTTFVNTPYEFHLKKTEKLANGTSTNNPMPNAEYSLFKAPYTIGDTALGVFYTDSNGCIDVTGLEVGNYVLVETEVPEGYKGELNYKATDMNGEDVSLHTINFSVTKGTKSVTKTDENQQIPGNITLTKYDGENQEPISGAVFALFKDEACTQIATDLNGKACQVITGAGKDGEEGVVGIAEMYDIPWGTYYLKETQAAAGYIKPDEAKKIVIGKESASSGAVVSVEEEIINDRKPGSLRIYKKDADDESIFLTNVSYELRTQDGSVVAKCTIDGSKVDTNGHPYGLIENIPWGNYLLVETKAPSGYSINSKEIKVAINRNNVKEAKEVVQYDEKGTVTIIAKKKIAISELDFNHGTPTFVFNVKSNPVSGSTPVETYTQMVSFGSDYVDKFIADNPGAQYITKQVTFSLPSCTAEMPSYILTEGKALRYKEKDVSDVSINTVGDVGAGSSVSSSLTHPVNGAGGSATFNNLTTGYEGTATFENVKDDYSGFSDTTALTNIVPEKNKYSSLTAEYIGEPVSAMEILSYEEFKERLVVKAIYEDGSSEEIKDGYTITDQDGNVLPKASDEGDVVFPPNSGNYEYTITYAQDGITCYDTVVIYVLPATPFTVTFDYGEKGAAANMTNVEVQKCYPGYTVNLMKKNKGLVLSDGEPTKYYIVSGWYLDEALTVEVDFAKTRFKEDTTVYAKWRERELAELSWDTISEVSNIIKTNSSTSISSLASTYVGVDIANRAYNNIYSDLNDGTVENSNYKYMHTITNTQKKAYIAGFREYENTGITFISYDSMGTTDMNAEVADDGSYSWSASTVRTTLNTDVLNSLDSTLKSKIVDTKVRTTKYSAASNAYSSETTSDKLTIPSQFELFGRYGFLVGASGTAITQNLTGSTGYRSITPVSAANVEAPLSGNSLSIYNGINADGATIPKLGNGTEYWTRSLGADAEGGALKPLSHAICYVKGDGSPGF